MALTRIHHVSQIAPDFDQAQQVYTAGMGLAVDLHRSPLPDGRPGDLQGARALEFPIGEMFIEVSCPSGGDSPAQEFLAERNGVGGMHHVAFASTDLQGDAADLERKGLRFLSRQGDAGPLFVDPETTMGLLIEIVADDHYHPHPHYRGTGLVTGMGHVGVAARSEEEVTDLFAGKFGFEVDSRAGRSSGASESERRREEPRQEADDDVSIVEFPLGGTVIEVSVPNDDISGTARFLAGRGPLGAAWHHICPFAPDVHAFMDRGNAAGMRQLGTIAPKEENTRVVGWFHPRSALGTLVEVWNLPPNNP